MEQVVDLLIVQIVRIGGKLHRDINMVVATSEEPCGDA